MSIFFKFNYILYKINKKIILIYLPKQLKQKNKKYCFNSCTYSNLIIHIMRK